MSSNLFGERFLGYRQPAWHHLGQVFEEPITASEAVKMANLDYQVIKAPMTITVPTVFGKTSVPIEDQIALVREPVADDPEPRVFGYASPNYGVLQNTDIAEILDALVNEWPVETAGALGHGETTFMSLDVGMASVGGEEVHQYFLATDTKDGKTAFRMAFTPIRVVCMNTLVVGLAQASVLQKMQHIADIRNQVEYRLELMAKLQKAQKYVMGTFDVMAAAVLSPRQITETMKAAYPFPARPGKATLLDTFDDDDIEAMDLGVLYGEATEAQKQWVYYCDRATNYRLGAKERLDKLNDGNPSLANTAWYVYNSVVEAEDFRDGPEGLFASSLWGARSRTKKKAYKKSYEYALKA